MKTSTVAACARILLALAATSTFFVGSEAIAQTTTIEFIVRQAPDGSTGVTPGASGDSMLFTGRETARTRLNGCGDGSGVGEYPVQSAMALDPGSGSRPNRQLRVVRTDSTDPLQPGTRLRNLAIVTNCTGPDNAAFTKFIGEEY